MRRAAYDRTTVRVDRRAILFVSSFCLRWREARKARKAREAVATDSIPGKARLTGTNKRNAEKDQIVDTVEIVANRRNTVKIIANWTSM